MSFDVSKYRELKLKNKIKMYRKGVGGHTLEIKQYDQSTGEEIEPLKQAFNPFEFHSMKAHTLAQIAALQASLADFDAIIADIEKLPVGPGAVTP